MLLCFLSVLILCLYCFSIVLQPAEHLRDPGSDSPSFGKSVPSLEAFYHIISRCFPGLCISTRVETI